MTVINSSGEQSEVIQVLIWLEVWLADKCLFDENWLVLLIAGVSHGVTVHSVFSSFSNSKLLLRISVWFVSLLPGRTVLFFWKSLVILRLKFHLLFPVIETLNISPAKLTECFWSQNPVWETSYNVSFSLPIYMEKEVLWSFLFIVFLKIMKNM